MDEDRDREVEAAALAAWLDFQNRSPAQREEDFELLCARLPRLRARLTELRSQNLRQEHVQEAGEGSGEETRELLERLAELARPIARGARFRREGILARGGMGVIHRAQDLELHRTMALKELALGPARQHARAASRFLEEAQITAQLDHPGILPVHELGVDESGHLFFAMKLVQGRDLRAIFDLVREGKEGWTQTRAVGVLLKVCEAMAYAHSKGVIHRDLKPGNVMVGSFGEVYVMDWGLARASGRRDLHDVRLKLDCASGSLHTERREEREDTPDSPLVTMDGVVVGTPAYMPPEQARGEIHLLSPRSDVYSIGAMLYDLLTGTVPFVPRRALVSKHTVLARVVDGPPTPISRLSPETPPELIAICEKAMARAPEERYPDTLALGDDLRAYLEHRVVRAHQTGAWAELSKWVERNRALALASAAAILALVSGLVASSLLYVEARENEQRAKDQARTASQRAEEVLRLSAFQKLADLEDEADRLWPVAPGIREPCTAWLAKAEDLIEELPSYRATLAGIRARAGTRDAGGTTHHGFASEEDRWWHDQLAKLVEDLEAFADEETGLCSRGISAEHGWGVRRRLEHVATLEHGSLGSSEARARWAEAIASIRDEGECPSYRGLELVPLFGLLPIGQDPDTSLWEFAHLASGAPAERGTDGRLVLRQGTGLVLVLIPGGSFRMGSQNNDPAKPNYDPHSAYEDMPVHEVRVSPFLLSKYEMTQDQWERFTGATPSFWNGTLLFPVESVSWIACDAVCRRLGLTLPSEAHWEYAARGGSETPWWPGADPALLEEVANLADQSFARGGGGMDKITEAWDDGTYGPTRVGRLAANSFGLHDVHGNVWEWCADWLAPYPVEPDVLLDPVRLEQGRSTTRVVRGGGFDSAASYARTSLRFDLKPDSMGYNLGLRPARGVAP
jgi:formylglycine-generating enzyme required for sulfatase activity/tRNA A-37 threonylcarbamoyl transferase component Bud32